MKQAKYVLGQAILGLTPEKKGHAMILKQICEYTAPWSTLADGSQQWCETFFGIVQMNSLQ